LRLRAETGYNFLWISQAKYVCTYSQPGKLDLFLHSPNYQSQKTIKMKVYMYISTIE
jgi:hypothetical protein